MKTMLKILCGAVVMVGFAAPAVAQEAGDDYATQDVNDGYAVTFRDDLVDGGGMDANTAMIRVRPMATRLVLIRPRLHFVNELLKSAESI